MNFLCDVGHPIDGSVLREMLEIVYGSNVITHMLTGKTIARANRVDFLCRRCTEYSLLGSTLQLSKPWKFIEVSEGKTSEYFNEKIVTSDDFHIVRGEGEINPLMPVVKNNNAEQRFILMLGERLAKPGCDTIHAPGDADVLIVQTAVTAATERDVKVVAMTMAYLW
ncbi:hypothetical protein CHS0354_022126 [Potamilus streckersoni]|uniref:Uncharacterized protein n=1 Tax=Potamilus streckersoni TaxID=2493646 RepID=A0AAE0VJK5_9BIVA|nr:hypothetical protein CHS0354_022126 [Potamilus streckersoni]